MNLQQIKEAVEAGKVVHWSSPAYTVVKDNCGQWLIRCTHNESVIGLTWQDGETLNGREDEFYIGKSMRQVWEEMGEQLDKGINARLKLAIEHARDALFAVEDLLPLEDPARRQLYGIRVEFVRVATPLITKATKDPKGEST